LGPNPKIRPTSLSSARPNSSSRARGQQGPTGQPLVRALLCLALNCGTHRTATPHHRTLSTTVAWAPSASRPITARTSGNADLWAHGVRHDPNCLAGIDRACGVRWWPWSFARPQGTCIARPRERLAAGVEGIAHRRSRASAESSGAVGRARCAASVGKISPIGFTIVPSAF
jgi:hypothetical protein